MYIHEALEKSDFLDHPNINGILFFRHGEWGNETIRIYISGNVFHSSPFGDIGKQLLMSNEWTPVDFKYTIKPVD